MKIEVGKVYKTDKPLTGLPKDYTVEVLSAEDKDGWFPIKGLDSKDGCIIHTELFKKMFNPYINDKTTKPAYYDNDGMEIEAGKTYEVLKNWMAYEVGEKIKIVSITENKIRVLDPAFGGECTEDAERFKGMKLREVGDIENKASEYKEVKVGYAYRCNSSIYGIKEGYLVEVLSVRRGIVKVLDGINHVLRIEKDEFLGGFTLVGKVERKIQSVKSDRLHYDSAIDTIAFAKANFPPGTSERVLAH